MDNDDMRRGQPTVHRAFDEWTAILAGDALLTLAFEIAARRQTHPDAGVRAELARVLAHAAGGRGMVLGQMLDLEAEKRGEPQHMSGAHVRRLQALKTGALIAAACEAGAVLAGAADEQRAMLRRYGENLGLAFQTADDLLDAQGDAAAMGKATGKDSAAGKATLVGLIGVGEARAQLAAAVANAGREIEPFGAKAAPLIEAAHFAASREH
jgi:farnesyl diphosphate synthase